MYQYIIRRILIAIPMIIVISMLLFGMTKLIPGDAFTANLNPHLDAKYFQQVRHQFHLDEPVWKQYYYWATNYLQGNYGISFSQKLPVANLIKDRIGNTIFLAITSLIFTYVLAIPLGVFQAEKPYSKLDYTLTGASFVGLSFPSFFGGLLFIYIFAFYLDWFPFSGSETAGADYSFMGLDWWIDHLQHVFLPGITLAFISIASYTRYVRASIMEAKLQDYVRTAYAKGVPRGVVLRKHVLRNSLMPLITLFGLDLGYLLGGAIITETIFSYPGLGQLFYTAAVDRDYPIVLAGTMISAIFIIVGNLVADILYAVADPRIRYD